MRLKATVLLCIVLSSQVNGLPFFGRENPGYNPGSPQRNYFYTPNSPTTYVQYQTDPVTGAQVPVQYITHTRPGGPITALIQNVLNTVGRLVGDIGGTVGNVIGGTLTGAGQLGQDILDFTKPISIHQIVRPHPDIPRPYPNVPPQPYPNVPPQPYPNVPPQPYPNVPPQPYPNVPPQPYPNVPPPPYPSVPPPPLTAPASTPPPIQDVRSQETRRI